MPLVLLILFIVVVYAIIEIKKFLTENVGTIFMICGLLLAAWTLIMAFRSWMEHREKKRIAEEQRRLRDEPLADGETSDQRILKRFKAGLEDKFEHLGFLKHHHRDNDAYLWWRSMMDLVEQRVKPSLDDVRYKQLLHTLEENRRLAVVSDFEWRINYDAERFAAKEQLAAEKERAYLEAAYDRPGMTGIEFETWCRDVLRTQGWIADTTKASGDQGADILATKGDVTIAFQCKYYQGSVGNAAVQQINAAKHFYDATHAIVVTKENTYTRAARELASKIGVKLLVAKDLEKINSHIQA